MGRPGNEAAGVALAASPYVAATHLNILRAAALFAASPLAGKRLRRATAAAACLPALTRPAAVEAAAGIAVARMRGLRLSAVGSGPAGRRAGLQARRALGQPLQLVGRGRRERRAQQDAEEEHHAVRGEHVLCAQPSVSQGCIAGRAVGAGEPRVANALLKAPAGALRAKWKGNCLARVNTRLKWRAQAARQRAARPGHHMALAAELPVGEARVTQRQAGARLLLGGAVRAHALPALPVLRTGQHIQAHSSTQ